MIELGTANSVEHNLRVIPDAGEPWVVAIRGGGYGTPFFGLRPTPHPDVVCVVAGGGAYLVNTVARAAQTVGVFPTTQVEAIPDAGMLVLASFTELAGVGVQGPHGDLGVIWHTERLALDDLRIVGVDGSAVECRAEDGGSFRVVVDAASGDVIAADPPPRGSILSFLPFPRRKG